MVLVAQSLVFCVAFCNLFPFFVGHCIVTHLTRLKLYLAQTLMMTKPFNEEGVSYKIIGPRWLNELYYLTTHTSLSPIRRGFAPGFVNYKKGALDSKLQVIMFTSCLPMVSGSLQVLRLLPPLKLVAMI